MAWIFFGGVSGWRRMGRNGRQTKEKGRGRGRGGEGNVRK